MLSGQGSSDEPTLEEVILDLSLVFTDDPPADQLSLQKKHFFPSLDFLLDLTKPEKHLQAFCEHLFGEEMLSGQGSSDEPPLEEDALDLSFAFADDPPADQLSLQK